MEKKHGNGWNENEVFFHSIPPLILVYHTLPKGLMMQRYDTRVGIVIKLEVEPNENF